MIAGFHKYENRFFVIKAKVSLSIWKCRGFFLFVCLCFVLFLQWGKVWPCLRWNDELMPQFPVVEAWLYYFFCLLTPLQGFNMAEIHWEYMHQDWIWFSFWEMFTKKVNFSAVLYIYIFLNYFWSPLPSSSLCDLHLGTTSKTFIFLIFQIKVWTECTQRQIMG